MRSPRGDVVQEVKERVDILEVVSEYVKLRPAGRSHTGLCPFHAEKTPSFSVSPERQAWYCFGCSEGGDVLRFLEKIENLSFREALERLAKRAGVALPDRTGSQAGASERDRLKAIHELACRYFEQALERAPAARAYVAERGLSPEMVRAFRIGYAPNSWDSLRAAMRRERVSDDDLLRCGLMIRREGESTGGYDRFRDRLIFPITDPEGAVIAFGGRTMGDEMPKYLNSPETALFSKSRILYGLQRAVATIKERREALVMEGYLDVIAAQEFGFAHAVAPLGTALTDTHLKLLRRWCDRVFLVFDADGAGMRAALRSLGLFESTEIDARVVVLPPGDDPDTLLRRRGAAPFAQALADARPILDYRMETLLSQHDLRTDEGYRRAMREIAPLLAQVVAPDSWMHRLAEIRSGGAAERVAFLEEDVRRQVRRGARAPSVDRFEAGGDLGKSRDDAPPASSAVRRLYKAEDEVLRACLEDRAAAGRLLERVPPDRFLREETRELAAWIVAHAGDPEWKPGAWSIESDRMQTLLGRLGADAAPLPGPEWIDKTASLLHAHWEQSRMRRLAEGEAPTAEELFRIQQFYLQNKRAE